MLTILRTPTRSKTKVDGKDISKNREELLDEIARMTQVVTELREEAHRIARNAYDFEPARLVLGRKSEDFERYVRFTRWLSEADYPSPDILWVGLMVVTGMDSKGVFWVTKMSGTLWNINDPNKTRLWLIKQGLANPKGDSGRDSYRLSPTAKLLTIMNGQPTLTLVSGPIRKRSNAKRAKVRY